MDIKSKNLNDSMLVRVVVFLLCAGLLVTSISFLLVAGRAFDKVQMSVSSVWSEDLFFAKKYTESPSFYRSFYDRAGQAAVLLDAQDGYLDNERSVVDEDYLRSLEWDLAEADGLIYYATDGKNVVTNLALYEPSVENNLKSIFLNSPAYMVYENGQLQQSPPVPNSMRNEYYGHTNFEYHLQANFNEPFTLYMAYDQEYIDACSAVFDKASGQIKIWIHAAVAAALASLIVLIYLLVTTGRRGADGKRKSYRWDSIPTEIQLFFLFLAIVLGGACCLVTVEGVYYGGGGFIGGLLVGQYQVLGFFGLALGAVLMACTGLWFLLSCVRNLKARTFIKNSLIYKILAAIWGVLLRIYNGGSIMMKVVLVTLAICLLSATIFLAPVVFVLILIFAPRWVSRYKGIKKGVEEVKSGNLNYKIPVEGKGEFAELAKGINEISEASSIAVQNELKNQRLKTELLSNVSHDLKTPLTSIITYVDLLKTEGLDCEDAPKYLDVLDQKSRRLQKLTEDLFDAAKASSGAMPVSFEKVELLSLIRQAMGEMAGAIEASKLEFRISYEQEKYYVLADGQLTWRVMENLFGNTLKYAQPGSRVYIDIREQKSSNGKGPLVILEMKNVSKTELNISADELMERFTRGDESRSTEGSGLGLAIAKDLVKIQNGWFEIKIDGDLFKTRMMLEAYLEGEGMEAGSAEESPSPEAERYI